MTIQGISEDLAIVAMPVIVVHVVGSGALEVVLCRQPANATESIKNAGGSDKDAADIHDDVLLDAAAGVLELLRGHTKLPKEDLMKLIGERMGKAVLPDGPCSCPICTARGKGTFVPSAQGLPS